MNKIDIINTLNKYDFNKEEFVIISGAALVLLGLNDSTNDIDIYVTEKEYNRLLKNFNCEYERTNEFGIDAYMIDNIINFSYSFKPHNYELIEGYKVSSIKDIYDVKTFLNREKDKEILNRLKCILNQHIIIRTLCDKEELANKIVDELLNKKLVSGTQVSKVHSKYWWNNVLEECDEYKIELRSILFNYNEIKEVIESIHDYEVAEISYSIIDGANNEFLNWIDNSIVK